jgi:SAM-dependent methyltransferase
MNAERIDEAELERFRTSGEYLAERGKLELEEFEPDFDSIMAKVGSILRVTPETKIFEVGAGLGWFEIICAKRGLSCSAIEFNPVIRSAALVLARRYDVAVDIALGNIEETDIGRERYEIIIATSVFEHVYQYGRGLARIYEALRPGGVFYFYSTNKFSLQSGEYPDFPFYGWFPYSIRKRIRISRQGPGIVESSGIDFNQFTYWGLVQTFKSLGFSRVLDRVDYLDQGNILHPSRLRMTALRAAKYLPPVRLGVRLFASGNAFICVK